MQGVVDDNHGPLQVKPRQNPVCAAHAEEADDKVRYIDARIDEAVMQRADVGHDTCQGDLLLQHNRPRRRYQPHG